MDYKKGLITDVVNRRIYKGMVLFENGKITELREQDHDENQFILPGFIDAHIHIESSMLVPYEFARIALIHGTVGTVSDPHEIANVCGTDGVNYMIENARDAKLKFHFGAPSCVPATSFETAGATLDFRAVELLLQRSEIHYLSEMMNYPGVLNRDQEVMQKIQSAIKLGKPVDGHAPGLMGEAARKYIQSGISTDHECFTLEEALDKLKYGMNIIIREGSAAKNFEALHELITGFTDKIMFCSDDKHPDDLLKGHINKMAARAVAKGHDVMKVLQCACVNPVKHYKMKVGLLQPGDDADFVVVNNLELLDVMETFLNGEQVATAGRSVLKSKSHPVINNFSCSLKSEEEFRKKVTGSLIHVIEALDEQLITNDQVCSINSENGYAVADPEKDILKIAVVNRYTDSKPAIGFIKNVGLKSGAIASTVAHDSHNIISVGVSDAAICKAVNLLIGEKGGLSFVNDEDEFILSLPVAGLMSDRNGEAVGLQYEEIDRRVKQAGCNLRSPFMTLSFMALLVIPDLKLSDKGLFSGRKFSFIDLEEG